MISKEQSKAYILEHKNNYSKESIKTQLLTHGALKEDIEVLFKEIYSSLPSHNTYTKKISKFTLFLLIFFILGIPLILLITGISIFNFNDTNSLLPNKIELSNNLIGDTTGSKYVLSENIFYLLARYDGAKRANIILNNSELSILEGDSCDPIYIENLDTKISGNKIEILNGHDILIKFNCHNFKNTNDGWFEGMIQIEVQNQKSLLSIPSSGLVRIGVTE